MQHTDVRTAWRCQFCDKLIYNLDEKGYPAPGAPPPRFVSRRYQKVCVLCFDIYHIFDENGYFVRLNAEWEERQIKGIQK